MASPIKQHYFVTQANIVSGKGVESKTTGRETDYLPRSVAGASHISSDLCLFAKFLATFRRLVFKSSGFW